MASIVGFLGFVGVRRIWSVMLNACRCLRICCGV